MEMLWNYCYLKDQFLKFVDFVVVYIEEVYLEDGWVFKVNYFKICFVCLLFYFDSNKVLWFDFDCI